MLLLPVGGIHTDEQPARHLGKADERHNQRPFEVGLVLPGLLLIELAPVVHVERVLLSVPAGQMNLGRLRRDGRVLCPEEVEEQHAQRGV